MIDYVNMETKTCFFGYGGIAVETYFQILILKGIKPPVGAGTQILKYDGTKVGDWEYTGSQLSVLFNTLDEVQEVCNILDDIENNKGGSFEFKGVVFDFTTYEQASVSILRESMEHVIKGILLSLAC